MNADRRLAVICMAGAALFWVTLLVAGWMTPGYSHLQDMVSELGAMGAPHPWLNAWFGILPFAGAVIASGLLIARRFGPGGLAWASAGASVLAGIGFLLVALTRCDEGCEPSTLAQAQLHFTGSAVGFNAMRFAPLLLGFRAFRHSRGRRFYGFALGCAVLYWIALFLLSGTVESLRVVGVPTSLPAETVAGTLRVP